MRATIGRFLVSLICQDMMTKTTTAHLSVGFCITEGIDKQVIFFRNHHKAHAHSPVTHAIVREVLAHEVLRLGILLRITATGSIGRSRLDSLLGTLGLHYIIVCLSRSGQHAP